MRAIIIVIVCYHAVIVLFCLCFSPQGCVCSGKSECGCQGIKGQKVTEHANMHHIHTTDDNVILCHKTHC